MSSNGAISYELGGSLYLNITNRCTNDCDFCLRNLRDNANGKDSLWLDADPTTEEILEDLSGRTLEKYDEIVFCGYGEPLARPETALEICRWLKQKDPNLQIRINTNGHGNLIAGRDITPEMEGIVDALSISMNAKDSEQYDKICHSVYGKSAYEKMLEFACAAKPHVPSITLTVVDVIDPEDIAICEKVASILDFSFRVRTMIN